MNKRKIIIYTLTGTIALAALSISLTLAWYGASDRLNVENLEVSVLAKGNLKISTSPDLDSFVENLTNEDLNNLSEDFLFAPVSTMHKDLWMSQKADVPEFYDSAAKQVLSSGEPYLEKAEFGFFQRDIYLYTTMSNQFATLDLSDEADGGSFFKTGDNFARAQDLYNKYHQVWGLELSEIQDKLDSLINCLRVSILLNQGEDYHYYIIDPTKNEGDVTYLGGRLDNDKNNYFDSYQDLNHLHKEVIYGEVNDRSLIEYDDPVDPDFKDNKDPAVVDEASHFLSNSFVADSKPSVYTYNKEKSEANGFEIAKEDSLSLEQLRNDDRSLLIPLTSGVPTKIVISIYLEGWDLDCINATMGASFNTKLSFKLKGGNV